MKNLKREIVENEERFRLVAEFAYDWEYWHDAAGNFRYTSPSVESITGYTPEDFLTDKHLMDTLIHPEDREKWSTHSHAKLENNEVAPIEFRIITKFRTLDLGRKIAEWRKRISHLNTSK